MSEQNEHLDPRLSVFTAWNRSINESLVWQEWLVGLGLAAWNAVNGKHWEEQRAFVRGLLAEHAPGWIDVESLATAAVVEAVGIATVVGYTLAKTEPPSLMDYDAWLDSRRGDHD